VWDRETGEPVYNAIACQDRRTADFCDSLITQGLDAEIRRKTGLPADGCFSGSKVRWILEHVSGARARAEAGKLLFGTLDSWLTWNFTRGKVHATDVSSASRTMMFNIHTLDWDEDLLQILGIPRCMLPDVRSSSEIYGTTFGARSVAGMPIAGIAGHPQAALFGQQCLQPGMVRGRYGTGCYMMMNTGSRPVESVHRLLATVAWQIGGSVHYALEGRVQAGGAVIEWLRDGLGLIRTPDDISALASEVKDSGGVYLVPAFSGLGAPHWQPEARCAMFGATQETKRAHVARAALDSVAFQSRDVLKAMEADSGLAIAELRVDGGASANAMLMQFQSDILGIDVLRPKVPETAALGAAYLAGLAVGYWDGLDDVRKQWPTERRFSADMSVPRVRHLLSGWQRAVHASVAWAKDCPQHS